ncbi:MAG: dephospho-CoA kinase [Erysipelotrichaceae bacterium]|nr:dephospho-CoA kinase [Erysipelotrichaceae bacterium]
MILIGITGSIGSGKSSVVSILKEKFQTIDCDQITHELLQPNNKGHEAIKPYFSGFYKDNILDKQALSKHVFNNADALDQLEKIIHPLVLDEVFDQVAKCKDQDFVFVEVPLLFEVQWQDYFDLVLLITIDQDILYQRLAVDRNMLKAKVDERLMRQLPQKLKMELADYIIENNGSMKDLRKRTDEFLIWLDQQIKE